MRRRGAQSGFTMLELILATAMMSMLAVSVYASLRIGFRARQSAMAGLAPARALQIAMELVRQDLESALPPGGTLAESFLGISGSEVPGTSALEFFCMGGMVNTLDETSISQIDPTASPGMRRIQLMVTRQPNGTSVLVRRTTRNLLSPFEQPAEVEILCRGVRTFVIRYFDGLVWQEEWDSTQQGNVLPMAIEILLELDPPGGAPVPSGLRTDPANRTSRIIILPCATQAAEEGTGV